MIKVVYMLFEEIMNLIYRLLSTKIITKLYHIPNSKIIYSTIVVVFKNKEDY